MLGVPPAWRAFMYREDFMRIRSFLVKHRLLLLLLAVNIILRAAWLTYMHPAQSADFEWYFRHAAMLAHGDPYTEYGKPTAYWPIGYPLFLSLVLRLFGVHLLAALITNACLSIGIVWLLYALLRKLRASQRLAFVAALIYTLLPSQIEWNAVVGSEELSTLLSLLSIYLYLRLNGWRYRLGLLVAGVALGLSCDVQPIPLLFPALILVYERWIQRGQWKTAWQSCAAYFGGTLLGVVPVTIHNWFALRAFVPISTNGGVVAWQGIMTDGGYFWSNSPAINPLLAAGHNQVLEDKIGLEAAFWYWHHHPLIMILNGFIKIFDLYKLDRNAVRYTFMAHVPHYSYRVIEGARIFDTSLYYVLMLLAFAGAAMWLVRKLRKRPFVPTFNGRALWLPVLLIIYTSAVFFFFPAWDRFRYPIMPEWSALAGVGACGLWALWRSRSGSLRRQSVVGLVSPAIATEQENDDETDQRDDGEHSEDEPK
jgi:4-amino-4-deoxy-L-arabinose transferase-like glycosyltransferase